MNSHYSNYSVSHSITNKKAISIFKNEYSKDTVTATPSFLKKPIKFVKNTSKTEKREPLKFRNWKENSINHITPMYFTSDQPSDRIVGN